jgi:hypothetical protein
MKDLKKRIKAWLKDFDATQPGTVLVDHDTFEGSACGLLSECLEELERKSKAE